MEKSFGLLFFLKKSKFDKDRQHTIYLRITVNGKSTEISTRQRCDHVIWNAGAGRIEGRTENAKSINAELDILQRKAYDKRKIL